jgi:uncharacterized protein YkwD
LLGLINAQRNAAGMQSLTWHDGMSAVAHTHAVDMVQKNYLNLISPDGYDVFQSLVAANPPIQFDNAFAMVSQVATGITFANYFNFLMATPSSAAALMDPTLTHIGISGVTVPAPPGQDDKVIILGRNVTP